MGRNVADHEGGPKSPDAGLWWDWGKDALMDGDLAGLVSKVEPLYAGALANPRVVTSLCTCVQLDVCCTYI